MAERTRRRMTKREYNTHIFARARKAESPVQNIANMRYRGHWWQSPRFGAERSLAEEYEQDAIVNGRDGGEQQWFSSDASDREDFRNEQLEKLRKDFRKSLRSHPEFKDRSAKELTEIADAYLGGTDHDSFKSDAVMSALQEVSDYVTGDGEVAMSDERTWRDRYPKEEEAKTDDGKPAAAAGAAVVPRNGAPKAPMDGNVSSPQGRNESAPLRPRGVPQTDVTTDTKWGKTGPSDTGVRINGAPVEVSDTATRGQIRSAQRDAAAAGAIEAAEARKDAQNRANSGDRRRYQQYQADQDALDASMEARRERKDAERRAKEQARRDRRFNNRTLVNSDDWENLGRPGSDNVDYSDAKNADAKNAHDDRIAELRDSLARLSDRTLVGKDETAEWKDGKMVVTDGEGNLVDTSKRKPDGVGDDGLRYANDFYAYDPNRQRDLAELRKLVEKGYKDRTITDAQIEGAMKTLEGWESAALSRKNEAAGREQRRQAERMRGLRSQYGMEDRGVYDDASVQAYHDQVQKARRKEILRTMADGGGSANAAGYGKAWQQLLDAGFDPGKTLKTALGDPAVAKGYDDARMKIDTDAALSAAAKAEMRDQLKHRTIMTRAFKDEDITGVQAADIGAIRKEGAEALPDSAYKSTMLQNMGSETGRPRQAPVSMIEPRKPKKDDEVGASLGGYALPLLRPRRRA